MASQEPAEYYKRLRAILQETLAQTQAAITAAQEVRRESAVLVQNAKALARAHQKTEAVDGLDRAERRDYGGDMLRDSPLFKYRGIHIWPPRWMWTGKGEHKYPTGEIGVLKEVHVSIADPNKPESTRPYNRVYLFMEYRESGYLGCLLFEDATACRQLGNILSHQCGKGLAEIGAIDLTHLL
jgi:hypothetical protein